ncbi:MAG: hypothetical protein Q9221_006025 [Calogaya cf. arnoldii]
MKSAEGRMLSGFTKNQIRTICQSGTTGRYSRDSLSPETITVIQTWENIPLIPDTKEWRAARIRLVCDLLLEGILIQYQDQGLQASAREVGDARKWIFERPDGSLARYGSIIQPWNHKSLTIRDGNLITTSAPGTLDPASLPNLVVDENFNANRLRISRSIFRALIEGKRSSGSASSMASAEEVGSLPGQASTTPTAPSDTIQQLLAALKLDGDDEEMDED